jgi:hypothetical protein
MVYHLVKIGPTQGQVMDLQSGEEVKLSPSHVSGELEIYLTTYQKNKIEKARAAGRGTTLKLSAAQLKANQQRGSGLFSSLVKFAVPILKTGAKAAAKFAVDEGTKFAKRKGQELLETGAKKAAGYAAGKAGQLLDAAAGKVKSTIGSGIHDPEAVLKKLERSTGKGFLGNIGRWLGHKAVDGIASLFGGGVDPTKLTKAQRQFVVQELRKGVQDGSGFFGSLLRKVAHGGVDLLADTLGGSLPARQDVVNDQIRAALTKKTVKVPIMGEGLYLP